MVVSPCSKDCRLDPASQLCVGCFRTLDEIAGWGGAGEGEQFAVLERARERRRAAAAQGSR